MENLKNCPFCGSKGELITKKISGYYVVRCSNLKKSHKIEIGPYIKSETAIKIWNKRV